jgi:hypothetical protein
MLFRVVGRQKRKRSLALETTHELGNNRTFGGLHQECMKMVGHQNVAEAWYGEIGSMLLKDFQYPSADGLSDKPLSAHARYGGYKMNAARKG